MNEYEYEETDGKEFHPSAKDVHGHSERIQFRAPASMLQQTCLIRDGNKFPYRSNGEIWRHAIIRHFYYLATLKPVRSVLSQLHMMDTVLYEEEVAERVSTAIERLERRVSKLLVDNELGEAIRLVRTMQDIANSMPSGYWKRKFDKEIRNRYEHLLKNAPHADMDDLNEEEEKEEEEK